MHVVCIRALRGFVKKYIEPCTVLHPIFLLFLDWLLSKTIHISNLSPAAFKAYFGAIWLKFYMMIGSRLWLNGISRNILTSLVSTESFSCGSPKIFFFTARSIFVHWNLKYLKTDFYLAYWITAFLLLEICASVSRICAIYELRMSFHIQKKYLT